RVEYAETILSVTYAPYHRRPVHSLRLVEASALDYRFKSTDREKLNVLFNLRGEEDDILMVRDGLLTDTSICNIALWKDEEWLTPRYPLLEGTMRACLLASGQIRMADIRPADLLPRARIRLFNALIDFGELEIVI
ncbi:MAG: aminotransferase class IV, partial [Tannerellaceae bacterium]